MSLEQACHPANRFGLIPLNIHLDQIRLNAMIVTVGIKSDHPDRHGLAFPEPRKLGLERAERIFGRVVTQLQLGATFGGATRNLVDRDRVVRLTTSDTFAEHRRERRIGLKRVDGRRIATEIACEKAVIPRVCTYVDNRPTRKREPRNSDVVADS